MKTTSIIGNMKSTLKILTFSLLTLSLSFIQSCRKDRLNNVEEVQKEINQPPKVDPPADHKVSARILGQITDENGNAIPGALIEAGNTSVESDQDGFFTMTAKVFSKRGYVTVKKNGFFDGSRAFKTNLSTSNYVHIVLQDRNIAGSIDVDAGGTITLSNGLELEFPAGAIAQADGSDYTGTMDVAVAYLDPEDENFGAYMPGDMNALTEDGGEVFLRSAGMVNVELDGMSGEKLQVKEGFAVTMRVPVPSSLLASATSEIDMWYFDTEAGYWIQDGKAQLDGGKYVAEVEHFTPWNCDWQGPRATVEGKVVDCNGQPISGVQVFTDNVFTTTDEDGNFSRWVAADPSIDIDVYAEIEIFGLTSTVTVVGPLAEGDVVSVTIELPCLGEIEGQLVDCSGSGINGIVKLSYAGNTIGLPTDGSGNFYSICPENSNIGLQGLGGNPPELGPIQNITTGSGLTTVGNIEACGSSVLNYFTIDGGIFSNQMIVLDGTNKSEIWGSNTYVRAESTVGDYLNLNFPGSSTGSFNTLDPGVSWSFNNSSVWVGDSSSTSSSVDIIVNSYGPVGGQVSGEFSGNAEDWSGTVYTITDGHFSVERLN